MKKIIIIVVVLLILGAGAAYYFLVLNAKDDANTDLEISKRVAVTKPDDTVGGVSAPETTAPAATSVAPAAPGAPAAAAKPAASAPTAASTAPTAKPAATATAPAAPASKPTPATAPAAAAKPAAAPTAAKAAFKPYIINVASFTKKTEADGLAKELENGGYAVYQMDFEKGGVKYYRVRAGFYASSDEAKAAGKDIVKKFPKADSPWPQKIEKSEYDKYFK